MKWNFESLAEQHKHAFNELKGIVKLSSDPDGLPVSVEYSPDGIFVEKTGTGAVLHSPARWDFSHRVRFRMLPKRLFTAVSNSPGTAPATLSRILTASAR